MIDTAFFGVGLGRVWPLLSGDFSEDERQKVWLPACCAAASATWLEAAGSVSELVLLQWTAEARLLAAFDALLLPCLSAARCPDELAAPVFPCL